MDEPRPKWRISIAEALLVVLGLCVASALIRASNSGPGDVVLVVAVVLVAGTLATLIGMLSGREPMEGFVLGLVLVVVVGAIALLGLPMVQF